MIDGEPKYKKILIVSNYSINENSPLGITIRNIFSKWPKTNIFEIYRYTKQNNTPHININSQIIPIESLPVNQLFKHMLKQELNNTEKKTFQVPRKSNSLKAHLRRFFKYFSESIFYLRKSSSLMERIKFFKPEAIYTVGESLFTLKASLFLAKRFQIPIVIHYMDNWRETIYPNENMSKILYQLFQHNLRRVESKSSGGLVISPKMKREYSNINPNITYRVLLNSVEQVQKKEDKKILTKKSTLCI